jgi:hypothetical protein
MILRELTECKGEYLVTVYSHSRYSPQFVKLSKDQAQQYLAWIKDEGLIQDYLSDLSIDDREILISGIGLKEWAEIFNAKT